MTRFDQCRSWMNCRLVLCLVLMNIAHVAGASEIREQMQKIAKEVISQANGEQVVVGAFSPAAMLRDSNSSPGLEAELRTALEHLKSGIVTDDAARAKYEVRGSYSYVELENKNNNPDQGIRAIRIRVEMVEIKTDTPLTSFRVNIDLNSTESLGTITQFNASLPPEGTKMERQKLLDDARLHPTVCVDTRNKNWVRASQKSPYAVEILVKPADKPKSRAMPRAVEMMDGQPFVEIKKNEVYEVKVYNDSGEEVAANLSIDGVDVFHFAKERADDGTPKYNHFIISPHGFETIVGWYQKLEGPDNYLSFLVTDYGQGAISKTGMKSRGKVGVIQVRLAKIDKSRAGSKGGKVETGFGAPVTVKQEAVERALEPPHEFISIRYARN